jgi:hypothetical protein
MKNLSALRNLIAASRGCRGLRETFGADFTTNEGNSCSWKSVLSSELLGSHQAGVASNRLVCQDVQGGRRKVRARRDLVAELSVWNRLALENRGRNVIRVVLSLSADALRAGRAGTHSDFCPPRDRCFRHWPLLNTMITPGEPPTPPDSAGEPVRPPARPVARSIRRFSSVPQ